MRPKIRQSDRSRGAPRRRVKIRFLTGHWPVSIKSKPCKQIAWGRSCCSCKLRLVDEVHLREISIFRNACSIRIDTDLLEAFVSVSKRFWRRNNNAPLCSAILHQNTENVSLAWSKQKKNNRHRSITTKTQQLSGPHPTASSSELLLVSARVAVTK